MAVDDDEDDRDLFREAIKEVDASITLSIALDGEHALTQLGQSTELPDIIFLDINMPRMDGKSCLAKLKENDRFKNIPVVMHSTSFSKEDTFFITSHGAAVLQKQTNFQKMVTEIGSILHDLNLTRKNIESSVNTPD